MGGDETTELLPECLHTRERVSPNRPALQQREPPLDRVEPRRAGGREVKLEPRMLVEEGLHLRRGVRARVVENQVQVEPLRHGLVDLAKKRQELLGPMSVSHPPEHLARRDVESGVEACGPVAVVVVGPPLHLARPQRQHRLGAVEGLDLRLLVHREHHGVVRRVEVEPDDVHDLLGEAGVLADLEGLEAVRSKVGGHPHLPDLVDRHSGVLGHQPKALSSKKSG